MTPTGIEPVAFQFVAQHLNHCATAVPRLLHGTNWYLNTIPVNLSLQIAYSVCVCVCVWPYLSKIINIKYNIAEE